MDVDGPKASSSTSAGALTSAAPAVPSTAPGAAANGAVVPVKRGRGRPPKPKPPVDPNAPPKKRGRPPKPKPPVDPNAPPKKRGRPPKPKPPVDPNAPPKKRGRPPKPKPEGLPDPVPKKRGRPPKVRPVDDGSDDSFPTPKRRKASPQLQAGPAVASTNGVATPKRRGRPPKAKVVEPPAVEDVSEPEPPSEDDTANGTGTAVENSSEDANDKALQNGHAHNYTPTPTPVRVGEVTTAPESAARSAKRVVASLQAAGANRKRPRTSDLISFDEDVFGSPATISTEDFRANERLRKQREARNFTFEGDASAPRQTRSGRVVALNEDEYGAGASVEESAELEEKTTTREATEAVEDEDDIRIAGLDLPVETETRPAEIVPLPPLARPHVSRILRILTGREHAATPDDSEALQGLVSLLNGTVERGEGNSALLTGPRGVGKSMTVERALKQLPSGSKKPIIVRLSGHTQNDDRRAIREMGRQIAIAEGRVVTEGEEEVEVETEGDHAPTTLPSHLLALLTQPSPRAIVVIIDEFDLFTEHARQALLYCLLDVVQSVQTGPVETTPRGLAVIGITCRVDTLLLLEKRVKSRFSHRVWRVPSPLSFGGIGWRALLQKALLPWKEGEETDEDTQLWMSDWSFAVEMLLGHDQTAAAVERLSELTTDVRILYRPFIEPITAILSGELDFISVPAIAASIRTQLDLSGWSTGVPPGKSTNPSTAVQGKLRGLPHPTLGVLIVAKHLSYAGRDEFSLAQIEDEYLRFARLRLVGSGRQRWPLELLRRGFEHARALGLIAPAAPAGRAGAGRFSKVRSGISPHDVVAFFRAEGGKELGPELAGWGRMAGAHA